MEIDDLYACYKAYENLVKYQYRFILGRKGKLYLVEIPIRWNEFIHLTGITHLKDLPIVKVNRNILKHKIKRGEITMEILSQSQFYKSNALDIAYRIKYLTLLDSFFKSENLAFDYLNNSDSNSAIKADWLITGQVSNEDCYLFLQSENGQHKLDQRRKYLIISFFPKRGITYGQNSKNVKILFKQQIHRPSGKKTTLACYEKFDPHKYL